MEQQRKKADIRDAIFSLGESIEGTPSLEPVSTTSRWSPNTSTISSSTPRDIKPFEEVILDTWLKTRLAETKILQGQGDMEKWYSLAERSGPLPGPQDRVELAFPRTNRSVSRAEDP
jgi:hypothetical protein